MLMFPLESEPPGLEMHLLAPLDSRPYGCRAKPGSFLSWDHHSGRGEGHQQTELSKFLIAATLSEVS